MEFPLFETLAIEQGKIRNIALHQQRYERSLQAFYSKQSAVAFRGVLGLVGVWFGYGIIDILFKQVAKSGGAFPTTLFLSLIHI